MGRGQTKRTKWKIVSQVARTSVAIGYVRAPLKTATLCVSLAGLQYNNMAAGKKRNGLIHLQVQETRESVTCSEQRLGDEVRDEN